MIANHVLHGLNWCLTTAWGGGGLERADNHGPVARVRRGHRPRVRSYRRDNLILHLHGDVLIRLQQRKPGTHSPRISDGICPSHRNEYFTGLSTRAGCAARECRTASCVALCLIERTCCRRQPRAFRNLKAHSRRADRIHCDSRRTTHCVIRKEHGGSDTGKALRGADLYKVVRQSAIGIGYRDRRNC